MHSILKYVKTPSKSLNENAAEGSNGIRITFLPFLKRDTVFILNVK